MEASPPESAKPKKPAPIYPPLANERREAVDTGCAAWHLNRQPQTLRRWACKDDGPLRPLRVNGRLAWPMAAIRCLVMRPVSGGHDARA